MIVQFLFIVLVCYGTANGSDEKTSKILSCIQPSQPKRSIADGNRTWFVSGNSTKEQDIICSHIATSDGVRMCACMCKANLKTILKSFDAKWTVPKYQTCNNLEETKDLKINCYDLVTSDKSRICSCMCSFVQDKSENKDFRNVLSQELPLDGEISQSARREGNSSTEFASRVNQTSEATTMEPKSFSNTDSNIYVTPSTVNPSEDDENSFTIFVTTEKQSEDILREPTETERDGKEYSPKQNTIPDDNIAIVYPSSYYTTSKPRLLPRPMPIVTRVARSDEKVFYVYPQKKVAPEKPQAKSLRFINIEDNMDIQTPLVTTTEQSKLVQMVFAEQIAETPALVTSDNDTNTSEMISLDIEAAPGSPLIISAFPIQEFPLEEAANDKPSEFLGGSVEVKDLANDITGPGESSAENKAEDYMEDDSVRIAYSGKIYRRIPAEASEASSSTIDNQVVSTTEKIIPSTSEIPEVNNQIIPSAPLLVSLSSGYVAGPQVESSTTSSTTTSTTTTAFTITSSTIKSSIESSSTQKTTTSKDLLQSSATVEPSSSTAAASTSSTTSTTTTESPLSSTVNAERLDSAEDLKLKRQHQFMEFLKKRSQSSKHRLSATSLKKPSTTYAPSVNVRKTLLDASQRRAALLKSKGKQKPISNETSSTTETIKEKDEINDVSVETISQEDASTVESTSTTAAPKVTHSLRGGILHRRPLYVRTTKPPTDQ